ncbi:hypothetical protein BT93_B0073 [Corymbia citriodora subsp. variegata]|nr:hypothetical protein BT93_B0073 [Corymbia citriodora subsp. variegata]
MYSPTACRWAYGPVRRIAGSLVARNVRGVLKARPGNQDENIWAARQGKDVATVQEIAEAPWCIGHVLCEPFPLSGDEGTHVFLFICFLYPPFSLSIASSTQFIHEVQ